ncbi:MAG: HmuY family protein [Pseudomonadota bacterium]
MSSGLCLRRLELGVSCLALGCSSAADKTAQPGSDDSAIYESTRELEIAVPDAGRVYAKLAEPRISAPSAPADSNDWDLAFENYDVFSNSGPSGARQGAAFGQLDLASLLGDTAPEVPFLAPDKAGGAFLDWYAYDGTSHALYSRFHVYGVKRGDLIWKVQISSYYSEQDNAPLSGLYRIRYATLGDRVGATQTLQIDGTAGGIAGTTRASSGCLDLESGAITMLTPDLARQSQDWDLCFRRDSISVNGEVGGPRGVGAVDLQASETSRETLVGIQAETDDDALARFDSVSLTSLANAQFRGDHVVSAFETGAWVVPGSNPQTPARAAWLVQDAAGEQKFLIAFSAFREPTTSSPGTVVMHIKPVKQ